MTGAEWDCQRINGHVFNRFSRYDKETGRSKALIAPFDAVIRHTSQLQTRHSDVFLVSNEQFSECSAVNNSTALHIAPELVAVVLSPRETRRTIWSVVEDFCKAGGKECWLVSPESETVQILRLLPDHIEDAAVYSNYQTAQSLVYPDLRVALADIFAL